MADYNKEHFSDKPEPISESDVESEGTSVPGLWSLAERVLSLARIEGPTSEVIEQIDRVIGGAMRIKNSVNIHESFSAAAIISSLNRVKPPEQ